MTGNNAFGKVQRDQNIMASLKLLIVVANRVAGFESAKQVAQQFTGAVAKQLEELKGENNQTLILKQKCLNAWEKLNKKIEARERGGAEPAKELNEQVDLDDKKRLRSPMSRKGPSASPGPPQSSKFAQLNNPSTPRRPKSAIGRGKQ